MKKLFLVASLVFAVSVALAEVVTLKVQVDTKVADTIAFDVSKGREGAAELMYNYCSKLPKKTINALNKAQWFKNELNFGFDNPISPNNVVTGQLSRLGDCKFDKVKGAYKLLQLNGEDAVIKQGVSKESIIAVVAEELIMYYDAMSGRSAFDALKAVAEYQAEQKQK